MAWMYMLIGLLAGLIVSCWQGYKDPPWEGFTLSKFVRSPLVGVMLGLVSYELVTRRLATVDNLGMLLLAILATERLVGETYKGFLRAGPHPEYYKLLRRLHIPIERGLVKVVIGLLFLAGGLWLYWGFGRLGARIIDVFGRTALGGVLVGAAAGTVVAIGGAMKDSQFDQRHWHRARRRGVLQDVSDSSDSGDPCRQSRHPPGMARAAVDLHGGVPDGRRRIGGAAPALGSRLA